MSMKTIARSLVAACCAVLGLNAWAGWTGTLSNTTPTKVLDGTSLADLDNMTFSGVIGGGWMGGSGKVFEHFFLDDIVTPEEGDAYRLCQMEINDYNHATDCHLKFVTVKFTMGEGGIYAVQTDQGYVQNKGPELIGQKIDRSSTTYTVSNIDYPNYVLKSLDVVTEIKINDGETMTLTAENKPGADAIVYVNAGGTLDLHGIGDTDFTLILNGGTVKNTGNGISNGTKSLAQGIIVRADSTIDTSSNFGTIAGGYALHNINLGNHTLTKIGANTLFLSNVEFNGAGTIKIEQGMVRIYNSSTNQYPDNDHPGHSMASSGLVVDVKIASGAKLECYGAPKFHSITGVSDESKGELYLFGAEGLKGIPGCFDVSKVILGGNKSTGYIGWNESAVELTINSTFEITQGSSNTSGTIKTLKGTGSITKTWSETPIIYVEDHSGFTGSVAENIGVNLSIAKSETAYYYTIAQVKEAIATTDVTNISISDDDLAANGLKIVEGKIVAKTPTELFLEGIADGGDVALTGDVTLEAAAVIPADKTVTLDLNGYTITAPKTAISVLGTLTVKDTGTDGKIVSTGNCGIAVGDGATLTVNSGIIESVEGAIITGKAVGATITINGGTFSASDNAVIAGNGSVREGNRNEIMIYGGTFNGTIKSAGYIACGIYAPWKDAILVAGGTFNITGGCGVCARAGTVEIRETATINLINEGTVSGWVGDNKNAVPGVQAFFDYAAQYPGLTEGDAIFSDVNTLTIAETQEWVVASPGYKLVDKPQGPTSWEETTPSEVIELPEGATTTVTATEIAAWAAKNNVAFDAETTIPVNALIFNVAPDAVPADPEAAAAEILKDLAVDVESLIKNGLSAEALAQLAETYPMAKFELVAVEALPDTDNAKFRKLKVDLK